MEELSELRKIAESATPGNWMWVNDRTPELIRAGKYPYTHVTYTDDVTDKDSLHIATFDPPTVLALVDQIERLQGENSTLADLAKARHEWNKKNRTELKERLEKAEQDRVNLTNRLDAIRRQRDGYRNQLRKTEQQIQRVRAFLEYRKANSAVARVGLRALDGDGRG